MSGHNFYLTYLKLEIKMAATVSIYKSHNTVIEREGFYDILWVIYIVEFGY